MPSFSDYPDCVNTSSVLRRVPVTRVSFDPTNPAHQASLDAFIRTGNWGEVHFYCEAPYSDVPMTVLMKHAEHVRGVKRETPAERAARKGTVAEAVN